MSPGNRVSTPPRRYARNAVMLIGGLVASAVLGSAPASSSAPPCQGAIQHPIQLRVEVLDAVRPSAVVRLRLEATSSIAVRAARARLVLAGAAAVLSEPDVALPTLLPGRLSAVEFRVRVPAERALLQFRVEGEGNAGRLSRGAVYNLLPNGPTEHGRLVTRGDGNRLFEVQARRIGR